jgi:hypothetical protein
LRELALKFDLAFGPAGNRMMTGLAEDDKLLLVHGSSFDPE